MSLTITTPQGVEQQQVYHKDAHVFGRFAITFDDSNDPPDITNNTPEDAIDLRVRSSGEIFFWDSINELWKPTFPVNQVILFSVGDGQQYSPEAGDTQYLNPTLENISGGIIIRNGMPLVSGYTFLPEGGFEVDNPFTQGEVIQWSLETNITTEPIDYSVYTKRHDVATYSSIVSTGADRLIFVAADETNGGNPSVFFLKNNTLKRIISQDATAGAGQYQISLSLLQDALTSANSFSSTGDATTLAQAIAYAQGLANGTRFVGTGDTPISGETQVKPIRGTVGTFAGFSNISMSAGDYVSSTVTFDLVGSTWIKSVVTVPSPTYPFVKTSSMSGNANAAAIKDVRMYGADRKKKYRLAELSRNFGSNHFYTFKIEEEGQSRTQGVCGFRNFTAAQLFVGGVEPAAGELQTIYLKNQNGPETAEVDIVWSEVAAGTNLTFADYSGGGLDSRVIIKSDADRPVRFPNVSGDFSFIQLTNWISAANIAPWWNSSNTWALTFPMQQLVSGIEIENGITGHEYYLSAIGKNAGSGSDVYVRIGLVGGSANYLGFQINGLDVSTKKTYRSKDGVNGQSLTNSAGVTLKNITVDWPNIFAGTLFQSGSYAISGIASAVVKYREDADATQQKFRFLHPSELFAMEGEKLPIYEDSLHTGINTGVDNSYSDAGYKVRIDYSSDKAGLDVPFCERLGNPTKFNPADLDDGDTVRGMLTLWSSTSNAIINPISANGRDFIFHKFSPSELVGATGTINLLSDSITDYDVTGILGNRLVALGANPNFIGTRDDAGFKNEGRATWDCKRAMGRRTITNDNLPLKPATSPTQSAGLNFNSYLRPATPQELIDIPTYCFENNAAHGDMLGRLTENNYTESQAAGGSYVTNGYPYYTFDFEHYITFNSLVVGDLLITYNGLSFNDMTQSDTVGGLADCDLFQKIYTRSVYAYKNDAIILWGPIQLYSGKNNEPAFSQCIERAIKGVNSLRVDTSFTPRMDIHFAPNFMHISRIYSYDYVTNPSDPAYATVTSTNDTWVSAPIDPTHPFELGKKQYANALLAIIGYFLAKNQ